MLIHIKYQSDSKFNGGDFLDKAEHPNGKEMFPHECRVDYDSRFQVLVRNSASLSEYMNVSTKF